MLKPLSFSWTAYPAGAVGCPIASAGRSDDLMRASISADPQRCLNMTSLIG